METLNRMNNCGVVPVVVLDNVSDAVPAAGALLAGGVDVMEVTLRTEAGIRAISDIAQALPDLCIGAGTVLSLAQCQEAAAAGAQFIVSPGLDETIVHWCLQNGIQAIPGCVTPTEISKALGLGLTVLKYFPANIYGGIPAMKALAAPFRQVKFIPTGGIGAQNLAEYIREPFIYAVGGSWLCAEADITAGAFQKITALCAQARSIVLEQQEKEGKA